MPKQFKSYEITGTWTPAKEEVRGVKKPFFVILDGVDSEKRLHKQLYDAMQEMLNVRSLGKPAGLIKVDIDYTQVIEPLHPKPNNIFEPFEFSIV
jgi:hypothetical protein